MCRGPGSSWEPEAGPCSRSRSPSLRPLGTRALAPKQTGAAAAEGQGAAAWGRPGWEARLWRQRVCSSAYEEGRRLCFAPRPSPTPGPTGLHGPRLAQAPLWCISHPAPTLPRVTPAHSPGRQNQCLLLPPGPWAQPWAPTRHPHRPSLSLSERVRDTGERVSDGGAAEREPREAEGSPPPWGGQAGQRASQLAGAGSAGRVGVGQRGWGRSCRNAAAWLAAHPPLPPASPQL